MDDPTRWSHSTGELEEREATVGISGNPADMATVISSGDLAKKDRQERRRRREEKEREQRDGEWFEREKAKMEREKPEAREKEKKKEKEKKPGDNMANVYY